MILQAADCRIAGLGKMVCSETREVQATGVWENGSSRNFLLGMSRDYIVIATATHQEHARGPCQKHIPLSSFVMFCCFDAVLFRSSCRNENLNPELEALNGAHQLEPATL